MTQKRRPTTKVDPVQQARMLAALRQIQSGEKHIPLRCAHCSSASLYADVDDLGAAQMRRSMTDSPFEEDDPRPLRQEPISFTCATCGRKTPREKAKKAREAEIKKFIVRGVDIDLTVGRRSHA